MRKMHPMLLAAVFAAMVPVTADAGSRYAKPPAVTLSSDLTAPWVLQLERSAEARKPRRHQSRQYNRAKRQTRTFFGQPDRRMRRNSQATGIFAGFGQFQAEPRQIRQKQRKVRRSSVTHRQPAAVQQKPRYTRVNASTAQALYNNPADRPIDPQFLPQTVRYDTSQPVGTIMIDTNSRFLYLVTGNGKARRYGVGVGKEGFEWSGTERVSRKAEWPSWRPPAEMIAREREKGRELPAFMEGGPANPLGARAIYLGDTLYRIHGTNQPWTIGQAVSSGCIRMRNEDVMDLYERVKNGAKVIVS